MNRPIEDLLRQAYQAKVEPITEQRLSQLSDARADAFAAELADDTAVTRLDTMLLQPGTARRTAHSRWFAPILAAAAVVIVAAGAVAIATSHGQRNEQPAPPASHVSLPAPSTSSTSSASPTRPTSTPSTSYTSPAAAALLGHGQEADRTQIPWSQVAAGWTVALWTPSTDVTGTSEPINRDQPEKLYLVNPIGGRYLITGLGANEWEVDDWSGDRNRVLLTSKTNFDLAQLDLHTGQLARVGIKDKMINVQARYTKPLGRAILLSGMAGVQRVGLTGVVQLDYPTSVPGAGKLRDMPLYSPDGSQLLFRTDGGLALLANDGQPLKAFPRSADIGACFPLRWATPQVALADCTTSTRNQVWSFPVDGSAPAAVATSGTVGLEDSVTLTDGQYAESEHGAQCTLDVGSYHEGTFTSLNLGARFGGAMISLLGATRTTLQLFAQQYCGAGGQLASYNPGTDTQASTVTTLLGGSVNGGTVLQSVLYKQSDPPK
jgi:hypothetical protein